MEFHPRRKIEGHIDMTPMIDTLLQLFLIFFVTASVLTPAVKMSLPKASAAAPTTKNPIIVTLAPDNRLYLNTSRQALSPTELKARLTEILRNDPTREVTLRADRSLAYEKVLEALLMIQQAGSVHVHLAYELNSKR